MAFPWNNKSIVDILENNDGIEEKIKIISQDIQSKKVDVAQLVEELGPALTSPTVELRVKGTKMLSDVLGQLPEDLLTEAQLSYISTFYCDRLKDHHSVIPGVILGILVISKMKNMPDNGCAQLLRNLFQNIVCQSQLREDRANLFQIYKNMSESKEDELKAMGADFIYGVINSIDGERDPRNLLFLYEFMAVFIKKFPLKHLAEEMFEIFACYFPIDFNPAQNDPTAITRDLLAEKLANCLCASDEFTENCVNLALEKIDSQLNVAKLDSFDLLNKCMQEFTIENVEPHVERIWQALKIEMLPGNNKDVAMKALSCLDSMIKCAISNDKNCEYILTMIFTSIIGSLSDPATKLFGSSVRIALVCTNASKFSAVYCSNKLLPIFFAEIDSETIEIQQKCVVLELSQQIISICKNKDVLSQISNDYVNTVQKELIGLLVQSDSDEALKTGFECATKLSDLICSENRFIIYSAIKRVLLSNNRKVDASIQTCVIEFAHKYPEEIEKILLIEYFDSNLCKENKHGFDIYSQLIFQDYFTGSVIKFIYKNIFECEDIDVQIEMLKTSEDLLMNASCENPKEFILALDKNYKLIESIIEFVRNQAITLPMDLLLGLSNILKIVVKEMSAAEQENVIRRYMSGMKLSQINDIYLTSGILGYLDENAVLDEGYFQNLATKLTKMATISEDPKIHDVCNHLLCSLLNKMPDDEKHRSILKTTIKFLHNEIKQQNGQAVQVLGWIAKGLLARGHPDAAEVVQDLSDLLQHPTMGNIASIAFEIISIEYPSLHIPVIKHLFKQKLFVTMMKILEKELEHFSLNHLQAMSYVLQMTPHLVLKMEIAKVGPILFQCIRSNDAKPILIALSIINRFILESDVYIQDHLQPLVTKLLHLSTIKDNMKIRMEALQCLLNITNYPTFILMPFQQDVVLGLVPALDDHKRLVREVAVAARMKWYLIGSPSNENEK